MGVLVVLIDETVVAPASDEIVIIFVLAVKVEVGVKRVVLGGLCWVKDEVTINPGGT